MEDACKKNVNNGRQGEDNLPCTSKPCTWGIPKKRKLEPSTVQSVKFVKHVYGKKEKDSSNSTKLINPTRLCETKSNTEIDGLLEKIKKVKMETGKKLVSII